MSGKVKILFYLIIEIGLYNPVIAQPSADHLHRLDSNYKIQFHQAGLRIEKYLKKTKGSREVFRRDGSIMVMVDVSPSGIPIFIKSDNLEASESVEVNELRVGGSLGLNLEGTGIQIGIWDEGRVRNDHVEYIGRVTQIDANPTFNLHASHVLGTMIATGVNSNAKGMAPKATAIAFDFNGDVGEMISQAKPDQTSIILSNHSYGTLSGWDLNGGNWTWHGDPSISNVKDWKFGFYNSTSHFYDDIAYNAPYYLIVKSAGNDNFDVGDGSRPPDCDPFDCIPTNGVAKNILTVGAVRKLTGPYTVPADVEITSFSSLGPADDGRIKPDLVAPGQALFSASANTSGTYATLSGTSMSAPVTTGTLALLQELYKNLNAGNLMRSATLKALAIHTTKEAGSSSGPDYVFGWGLLDAEAAAKAIIEEDDQNIFIKELTLLNDEVFEMDINPKENTKITATLVWTDPAGPILIPSLNPTTKMLVNDLDLVLTDDGGTSQFPWKLNPLSPQLAATKGNNVTDNVEKLEFDLPQPRSYKLSVSHKGNLVNGSQDFSLILSYTSVIDPRISYYWIGNTGSWDDGANWSLSSGGIAANAVPGPEDNIVFDENSFSSDNQTVTLNQDQEGFSLRWFANREIDVSFNSHSLSLGGGLNLLSEEITSVSPGTIVFNGNANTDAAVNLNNNVLDDISLRFSGTDAKWSLTGDFQLSAIELEEGSLTISNNAIKIGSLSSPGVLPKSLILDNSEISGLSSMNLDFSGIHLEASDATIRIPSGLIAQINFGENLFEGILDLTGGEVALSGDGIIKETKGFGTLIINGNFSWEDFTLNGGSSVVLKESRIQTFTNQFSLPATPSNRISIESDGPLASTLQIGKNQKICLDNLDVENVVVSGEGVVSAGLNSVIVNSPGWVERACADVLFADFDVEFTCEKASVFFMDKSSGPIEERTWNFGDEGSGNNESNKINPIHFYETVGPYVVSLQVSNGAESEVYTKEITLTENLLEDNRVELSNGKLISFLPAEKYQWVLDGELLENSNLRSIDFSNEAGEYAVLTFDEVCNKRSSVFLVTGFGDENGANGINVYPNPASDKVTIQDNGKALLGIRMLSNLGQPLNADTIAIESGWQIDVSEIPKGIYVLQLLYQAEIVHKRIIVR